jgi:serine phosphatase RsbU (regulator of sigma subunit)
MVGDVSGNGVPGSLFMAVSKALCKSAALRYRGDLAAAMQEASAAIARDNAEALFVTVWSGVLDPSTGALEYCNAGHEPAWLVPGEAGALRCLADGGGPPLGLADAFAYAVARCQLQPGDTVCVLTDGVTEAGDPGGRLYGRPRLETTLRGLPPGIDVEEVSRIIRTDVARFAGGAEPEDDITMLVIRWAGATPPRPISAP